MHVISLSDALVELLKRPVLVYGPSTTSHETDYLDLSKQIAHEFGVMIDGREDTHFLALGDLVQSTLSDRETAKLRTLVERYFRNRTITATAETLAKGRWSAFVSLTFDNVIDELVANRFERAASSWELITLAHPSDVAPPLSTPVFRLMGRVGDSRPGHQLAISDSDILRRRTLWPKLLATLPEFQRNAPLFFVGTECCIDDARALMSAIFGNDPPYPSRILFLNGDGTACDPTLLALCRDFTDVAVVDCDLSTFCTATAEMELVETSVKYLPGKAPIAFAPLSEKFLDLRNIVDVVPFEAPSDYDLESNRKRLFDALFRPTVLDWGPYLFDLDFRRQAAEDLIREIDTRIEFLDRQRNPILRIRGEAGVGKSTFIKRVAVDLAKKGRVVLWCKRPPSHRYREIYRKLGLRIRNLIDEWNGIIPTFVVVCDDPIGIGVSAMDILDALDYTNATAIFIVAARNSDILAQDADSSILPERPDFDFELPHELSPVDLEQLRIYMTSVKLLNAEKVDALFDEIPSKDSADVLCSLWYLLPETREPIANAISSEYQRLGGATGAIEAYAYAANEIGDAARHAYESVAVTSNLGIGLPYEVLLRACGIEYNDWRDMCVAQKPVWGLLYDDVDPENQNLLYRTRNHIVTRVLVNLINAGRGHAGEFRVLKRLVAACTSSTVPYRTFLVDLLVRNQKKLQSMLSYQQGVELFQTAINSFPSDDDLIEHHFGIWHRVVGNDYEAAYDQFQKALDRGGYKYSGRAERKEFIHTSMGATIVDMVKSGRLSREDALESVRQHLREASHPSFFNPHTDHVFANLLFILARTEADERVDSIALTSIAEALATIEHSLQMMGTVSKELRRYEGSVNALLQLQKKVLMSVDSIDDLKSYASDAFLERQNQSGFEIIVRRMLGNVEEERRAGNRNIGQKYKEVSEYVRECLSIIEAANCSPTPGLIAAKVDLTIRWRLQSTRGPIDWDQFRNDLEFVLSSPQYRDDIIRMYYLALSLFHLGEFTEANSIFEILKRKNPTRALRIGTRNYFVGAEGFPKRVQAEIRRQHGRTYAYIPEITLELEAFGPVRVGDTGIASCYVAFSLAGPTAQFGDLKDDLELA